MFKSCMKVSLYQGLHTIDSIGGTNSGSRELDMEYKIAFHTNCCMGRGHQSSFDHFLESTCLQCRDP